MATATQITTQAPPAESGAVVGVVTNIVAGVGALTLRGIASLGAASRFTGDTLLSLRDATTWLPEAAGQMWTLGVASLPIALFIASFTGIVLALLASYSFTGAVPLYFVGTLVEKTITLELAPVLTGLALAGRVGANIAAELGTMRVTEQIDALEALATEPVQYLFVPRVFASVLMMPLLVVLGDVIGMIGGYFVAVNLLGTNSMTYYESQFNHVDMVDFTSGIVKAAVFGLIFSVVACVRGYYTVGGAEGVGRSTTRAVVVASLTILLVDFFLTRLLF